MDRKWVRSRKKTFTEENNSPKPTIKRECSIIIISRNNKSPVTLKFKIIKKGNKKTDPIKKFKRLLKTEDIGINSRGNMPCLNIEELTVNEVVASEVALAKKSHGIMPASTNRV